jgi:hypothetical protein
MTLIRKRRIFMKNLIKKERENGRVSKINFPQISLMNADLNIKICDNLRDQREKRNYYNNY